MTTFLTFPVFSQCQLWLFWVKIRGLEGENGNSEQVVNRKNLIHWRKISKICDIYNLHDFIKATVWFEIFWLSKNNDRKSKNRNCVYVILVWKLERRTTKWIWKSFTKEWKSESREWWCVNRSLNVNHDTNVIGNSIQRRTKHFWMPTEDILKMARVLVTRRKIRIRISIPFHSSRIRIFTQCTNAVKSTIKYKQVNPMCRLTLDLIRELR